MITNSMTMPNEELIPGMEKIIEHIKKVQEENKRLKQENQRLRAEVQARVQKNREALEQPQVAVSFD